MDAFFNHPEQWEDYKANRPDTTVDEIVRWATPVSVFQRVALEDIEINGQLVKEGDRVGLFYASGNFDEDNFDEPYEFNINRQNNNHLRSEEHTSELQSLMRTSYAVFGL